MEYPAKSVDVGEKDLQTLVHGDCWTTNMMYLYDDEKIQPQSSPLTSSSILGHLRQWICITSSVLR